MAKALITGRFATPADVLRVHPITKKRQRELLRILKGK